MSRDNHYGEVQAAISTVGEVQDLLSALTDRLETTMGAIIMAVGQTPHVESAQTSMNFTAEMKNRVDEIYRISEQVIAELRRYGDGF